MVTGIESLSSKTPYSLTPQPVPVFWIGQVPKTALSQADYEKVTKTAQGIGCILNRNNTFNGSAILISPVHILVPRHCFLEDVGDILFNGKRVRASTLIDGELDPGPSFKGDYKILYVEDEHQIPPAQLSVAIAEGCSVQINYQNDLQIYIKIYESVKTFGNFASRSDLASMKTFPGDSGGARFSLSLGAVHSMHQGESEGLKMNDIVHSLQNISKYHPDNIIKRLASEVWEQMNVRDRNALSTDFSSTSLQAHHVQPEGPPPRIPNTVYRWTDSTGAKHAKKHGILIDPNQAAGSIPTLITSGQGQAYRSGALRHYDRLLMIDTTLIPDLTHNDPILSGGGHWQYNITCDIPKTAITVVGRHS